MEKILTSKVAVVAMILLFLMGASMRPSKACRVLINGHGGAQVNREEPSLIVLQTLKKGSAPCTGNCGGYTPGSAAAAASTTGTKAFAGRSAVGVPPRDYSDRVPRSGAAAGRK
ncbi:hypothetical protein NL676_023116 [Syzygium grande]|nr:hypothetical protein NL676_023116 [Syzygium grande]